MLVTSSAMALASTKAEPMGEITIVRTAEGENSFVTVNGERAFSGRTVLANAVITTPENARAIVNLGKAGSVEIEPNSTVQLGFTETTVAGKLNAGDLKVAAPAGISVQVETANGIVTNNVAETSVLAVNAAGASAQQDDDDDDDDGGLFGIGASATVPVLIFAGIVTGVVIYTVTQEDDEDLRLISPIR